MSQVKTTDLPKSTKYVNEYIRRTILASIKILEDWLTRTKGNSTSHLVRIIPHHLRDTNEHGHDCSVN